MKYTRKLILCMTLLLFLVPINMSASESNAVVEVKSVSRHDHQLHTFLDISFDNDVEEIGQLLDEKLEASLKKSELSDGYYYCVPSKSRLLVYNGFPVTIGMYFSPVSGSLLEYVEMKFKSENSASSIDQTMYTERESITTIAKGLSLTALLIEEIVGVTDSKPYGCIAITTPQNVQRSYYVPNINDVLFDGLLLKSVLLNNSYSLSVFIDNTEICLEYGIGSDGIEYVANCDLTVIYSRVNPDTSNMFLDADVTELPEQTERDKLLAITVFDISHITK